MSAESAEGEAAERQSERQGMELAGPARIGEQAETLRYGAWLADVEPEVRAWLAEQREAS
ncbi:hypothetical protein [Candidatus Poriferisodalis sp.]|uniref:hypothetical protein n=1 Tax=Candidatus Poriferisodalis sp. TaxID=3101277 RepID=UPI003B5224D9